MGFGSSSPAPPPPAAPPPPPTESDAEVQRAKTAAVKKNANRQGRRANIKTGGQGVLSGDAPPSNRLLGS